jgi:hypothetical protein
MSYASVEAQKGATALEEARIRADSAKEVADITSGASAEAHRYGAEKAAEASMFGAETGAAAHKYSADQTLAAAVTPKENYDYYMRMAKGGPVQGRRPYLVGEKGPELMVPDTNGTIIPNHKLPRDLRRGANRRAAGGDVVAGGAPVKPEWLPAAPAPAAAPAPGVEVIKGMNRETVNPNLATAARVGSPEWIQARTEGARKNYRDMVPVKQAYEKRLLQDAADIDVTGARGYHKAMSLAPIRAEKEAVGSQHAADYNEFYKTATGKDAVPKPGDPDFGDYHGGYEVAKRHGLPAAQDYHKGTMTINAIKSRLTPENVAALHGMPLDKATAFVADLEKDPGDKRKYLLENAKAFQTKFPESQPGTSASQQLEMLGRGFTPNWMRPKEWGPAQ